MGERMNRIHTGIFGITYGPSGSGKTLALIRAFPEALFVAPPGALRCGQHIGWTPKGVDFKSLLEYFEGCRTSSLLPCVLYDARAGAREGGG